MLKKIVRHIIFLGSFFVLVFISRPFLYENLKDFILLVFPANPELHPGIQGAVNLIYLIIFGFTICCGSMALIFSTNILYGVGIGLFTFVIMGAFIISKRSTETLSILAFVFLIFGILGKVKMEKYTHRYNSLIRKIKKIIRNFRFKN